MGPSAASCSAALCGPLCGGPLLCGPLCGSSRRLLLAAFCSAFLRHSFFVICLSFAASAAVLSHMVHSESELLAQSLAHGPPHDHVDRDRPQPRMSAAVVDTSPAQPHAWLLSGAGHTGAHARRITTSPPISRAVPLNLDPPLSGAAASATASADHDTQGAALLADPPLSGAAASATTGADHDTQGLPSSLPASWSLSILPPPSPST